MAKAKLLIYSVSQVNAMVSAAIEERVPARLVVSGQITDFKVHASGHCYFSLKDQSSILSCVMWASKFRALKFEPENGLAVLVSGHIEVYQAAGRYQLYADKIEPAGVGALQLAFEQLKTKLQAEGLFDDARKRPLPAYPMNIGVITSASGAAVKDIQNSVFKRWPCKLFLFDVPVQGEGAAEKIAAAIAKANQQRGKLGLELLIIGRGGGSMEDLWAFNEEVLARAIVKSHLPVISAVGHEVDFTIADFVADVRASTPTQAGVIAVPDKKEVLAGIESLQKRLSHSVKNELRYLKSRIAEVLASGLFRQPGRILQNNTQQLDDCHTRLNAAIQKRVELAQRRVLQFEKSVGQLEPMRVLYAGGSRIDGLAARLQKTVSGRLAVGRQRLDWLNERMRRNEPHRRIQADSMRLAGLGNRLGQGIAGILSKNQLQMAAVEHTLQALNPKAVLERGYSITHNCRTGRVVGAACDVNIGDVIWTELARQEKIESVVQKTLTENQDK